MELGRRQWLMLCGGGLGGFFAGCYRKARNGRTPEKGALTPTERKIIFETDPPLEIVGWDPKSPEPRSVLRKKASPAMDLPSNARFRLEHAMRETLSDSGGVGLAAPQVNVSRRMIHVQLQTGEKPVLVCLDPEITERSKETVDGYEACLSIEGYGGLVRRAETVEVAYRDLHGKKKSMVSKGWEARIFQHEIDHLEGVLYLDRLVGELLPIEEMRRRREQEQQLRQEALKRKEALKTESVSESLLCLSLM